MHTSINQAIIGYVVTQLKAGNLQCCEKLGFNEEELRQIKNLSVNEVIYLCNSTAQFCKVEINHNLLGRILDCAQKDKKLEKTQDRALMLDASIELMQHFFGLTSAEVSGRRKLLGRTEKQGRKKHCSEETENEIWLRWKELKKTVSQLNSIEALDTYMLIAEEYAVSLTSVWKLIQSWENQN
ncbi:DUF2857 domain-containing protein [Pasteurella multocida]|uniref:DUF2857 domain-containing protein n=1 Tax=Pasteurella multocida TaxID=747 RepID=UPI00397C6223